MDNTAAIVEVRKAARRFIGTCKACKRTQIRELSASGNEVACAQCSFCGQRMMAVGAKGLLWPCLTLTAVKGKHNPNHECDARCLNSKGHICECACGGANHGKNHG